MDATFSPEQLELRRAVRDAAADRCSPAARRAWLATGSSYDDQLWQLLGVELGLAAIAAPESAGGAGGSFVDAAVVLEEAGRALLPIPLLGSIAAATVVSDTVGAPAAVALAHDVVVSGDRLSGEVAHVLDGAPAEQFVLATPQGLFVVDRSTRGARVDAEASFDLTRWQARLSLDDAPARPVGDVAAAERAVEVLRVALSVEAVGVARQCLEMTAAYLKERHQFGRPIGSFQALQHRAADLVVAVESAASTAYYAAWAAAEAPDELSVVAPLALAVCGEAAYQVAAEMIQLHGGIGFTWEHDAHLYFKRATATRLVLGDAHEQRRLVADRASIAGR